MASNQLRPEAPQGEILVRVVARPADTTDGTRAFGGWVFSQMDVAAGLCAFFHSRQRYTTVAADRIRYFAPIHANDEATCYTRIERIGRTSMEIIVEVWIRGPRNERPVVAATGVFTYVAIDDTGAATPILSPQREKA